MNDTAMAPMRATRATPPAPEPVPPSLPALYEAIYVGLLQAATADLTYGPHNRDFASRLVGMATDKFTALRKVEARTPVALVLEAMYDVEALVNAAHDVCEGVGARVGILMAVAQAADQATDLLANSPDWHAEDLDRAPPAEQSSNDRRAAYAFSHIGLLARCVHTLCCDVVEDTVDESIADRAVAAGTLAKQIGLAAELAEQDSGSDFGKSGPDVRAWVLPPAYQSTGTEAQQ